MERNMKSDIQFGFDLLVEIIEFFKTGVPPIQPRETIEMFAFMEAADESKRQGGKPVSMEEVFKKAQAAHAAGNK